MSRKSKKADAEKAAKEPKPTTDFIPMPAAFNASIQQIMQQAQLRAQDRVSTAMELNSDIPKDWRYNVQRGGFVSPAQEGAPDGEKREDQG
ncbi:MAG: hypothetical protein ACYTBJ_01640 [Planctomycetota bacterium]|jgi:hypothetical protein